MVFNGDVGGGGRGEGVDIGGGDCGIVGDSNGDHCFKGGSSDYCIMPPGNNIFIRPMLKPKFN